ncbi:MAG: dipicolinate synthase subunit DpsA [Oscillospiraceae bacterium]
MKPNMNFIVAGGDARQIYLAEKLAHKYNIIMTGFDKFEGDINNIRLDKIPNRIADGIILPVPISADGYTLNTPFSDENIMLADIIPKIVKNGIAYGGKFSDVSRQIFSERGIETEDYSTREEFSVMNAIATAEGALQVIMENSECMICEMRILITGFGRIGKILADRLCRMGADVTAAMRKKSDMAWAEAYGCKHMDINNADIFSKYYDIIINTVPHMVISREIIDKMYRNVLIIDLASKPGGAGFTGGINLWVKKFSGRAEEHCLHPFRRHSFHAVLLKIPMYSL